MLADQRGVDTFPMRLICYATLTAAIAWIAISGLQDTGDRRANDRILLEMDSLFAQRDGMWGGDAAPMDSALYSPGASVLVRLHQPDDTGYLAFGTDPGAGGNDIFSVQEGTDGIAYLFTDSLGQCSSVTHHSLLDSVTTRYATRNRCAA